VLFDEPYVEEDYKFASHEDQMRRWGKSLYGRVFYASTAEVKTIVSAHFQPSVIVEPAAEQTYNEHGNAMLTRIENVLESEELYIAKDWDDACIDLRQAKEHLKDALTRYNSATYRIRGTWNRVDPDKG
jgi:hypothetical protein